MRVSLLLLHVGIVGNVTYLLGILGVVDAITKTSTSYSFRSNHNNNNIHHYHHCWGCVSRGGGASTGNDDDDDDDTTLASSKPTKIPSGGTSTTSYATQLEIVKEQVLASAMPEIDQLRKSIIQEASPVEEYGSKADTIVNKALEEFAKAAPESSTTQTAMEYETKLVQLESALDAPLQVLFWKQLQLLREDALQRYRTAAKTSGASEYEAMLQADAYFVRAAEESTRDNAAIGEEWDYSRERTALQSVMNTMAESGRKATDIQLKSAQQQQTAMQFLQQQQQMIQQLQMQLYGQTSPWNVGVAYRIPDTNFNLQGTYQQGRTNIQLSCVPDEYAQFLGPNGFTNGVGPGNLGLSLNLSV